MDEEACLYSDDLEKVEFAINVIESGLFVEEQITTICCFLGFTDTAFRDKLAKDKLNDFLLNKKYWINPSGYNDEFLDKTK
jgi:hypothetical protein